MLKYKRVYRKSIKEVHYANPFTTAFSKTPENTYIHIDKTDEILENFSYGNPSESVYKITGVRGSGKTVILAKVEEESRHMRIRLMILLMLQKETVFIYTSLVMI